MLYIVNEFADLYDKDAFLYLPSSYEGGIFFWSKNQLRKLTILKKDDTIILPTRIIAPLRA